MAQLTPAQALLFLKPNYAVVAVLRPDGSPQQTVVWVDWDGENVVFNTAEGRAKPRYLRRDARASVCVIEHAYKWVSVSGPAEMTTDGAAEHIDKLARKYAGRDSYGLRPGEQRIIVRVRPERVYCDGVD